MYDGWSITIFNVIFTGMPIICYAIQERDVSMKKISKYPELYECGQKGQEFSMKLLYLWLLNGVYHAVVMFFFCYAYYTGISPHGGRVEGEWGMGVGVYATVVLTVNLRLALEMRTWTWITSLAIFLSVVAYFCWMLFLSSFPKFITDGNMYAIANHLFDTASFWLYIIIATAACIVPNLLFKCVRNTYWPNNIQIVQEEEVLDEEMAHEQARPPSSISARTTSPHSSVEDGASTQQSFAVKRAMKSLSFSSDTEVVHERCIFVLSFFFLCGD